MHSLAFGCVIMFMPLEYVVPIIVVFLTYSLSVTGLVVLSLGLAAIIEKLIETKKQKYGRRLPGPRELPFIGNGHLLMGDAIHFLKVMREMGREYGERYRAFAGPFLFIILSGPADVEAVLSSNKLINKSLHYEFLQHWLGEGLLTSGGNKWRKNRKLITPAFHFTILKGFIPIFEKKTDIFINRLLKQCDGTSFDVYPMVTRYALDVISESAMGVTLDAQTDLHSEYVQDVKTVSLIVNERMRNILYNLDWIFKLSKLGRQHDAAVRRLHTFTQRVISERKKALVDSNISYDSYMKGGDVYGGKRAITFLDLLLLSETEDGKLSDKSVREEVDTFMFEGHDTTTSGISFALYLIAENIDIQIKLYDEQMSIFGDDFSRPTTYSDLQEMKYLDMAIKETLRIFPSVPFIGRYVTEDININGMILPKDANIVIDIINMNRNPKVFEDPLEFRPERFHQDLTRHRNPYSSISFSAGPRNCIGQKFAVLEMKTILSKVIRNFTLKPAKDVGPLVLSGDLILKSASGVHIKLEKRCDQVNLW